MQPTVEPAPVLALPHDSNLTQFNQAQMLMTAEVKRIERQRLYEEKMRAQLKAHTVRSIAHAKERQKKKRIKDMHRV